MPPRRVPVLTNPNIVIRLANNDDEVRIANDLVFRNYVDTGYWQDDERQLTQNRYLHTPARRVFVVVDGSTIIGTLSIIHDSEDGVPADSFQPAVITQLRSSGERFAEISAFAFAKNHQHQHTLLHFLMAFLARFSFYYAAVDQLIAVCTPRHARFYEFNYGFRPQNTTALYDYVQVKAQMLILNLREAFEAAAVSHGITKSSTDFLQFLYRDEHANLQFPSPNEIYRVGHNAPHQYSIAV